MNKQNNKNIGTNSVLYLCSMLIPKMIALLTLPLFSYYIDPQEQGIYAYTQNMVSLLCVIATMGLNTFYLRYCNEGDDKKKFDGTLFWGLLAWNVLLLLLCVFAGDRIWKSISLSFDFYPYVFMALLYNFFLSVEIIPIRMYRMRNEVKIYFIRVLQKTIIANVIAVLLIVVFKQGIMGRYWADLVSSLIMAIYYIFYMCQNTKICIDKKIIKRGLNFSLRIVPSNLIQVSEPMIKSIIIESKLTLYELGIYSMGATLANMISLITQSILMAVEPEVYMKVGKPDYNSFMVKIKNFLLVVGIIVGLFFSLFIEEAVKICLDITYLNAWRVVQPIILSYVIAMLTGILTSMIIISGKGERLIVSNIFYMFVNIIGTFVVLGYYDVTLLGWTNVLGQLIMLYVMYFSLGYKKLKEMHLSKDVLMIGIMYGIVIMANAIVCKNEVIRCAIKFGLWGGGSLAVLMAYKISPKQLLCSVKEMMEKRGKKQ